MKAVDSILMIPSFNSRFSVAKAVYDLERDAEIKKDLKDTFESNGIEVTASRASHAKNKYLEFSLSDKANVS